MTFYKHYYKHSITQIYISVPLDKYTQQQERDGVREKQRDTVEREGIEKRGRDKEKKETVEGEGIEQIGRQG